MTVGVPSYVTVTSTGGGSSLSGVSVSPWQKIDPYRNPVNVTYSVYSSSAAALSSGAYLQFTVDDPAGYQPNPMSPPGPGPGGPSSAPFVVAYSASAFQGNLVAGSSGGPIVTFPFVGSITVPFTAWRLVNSSTSGSVIATQLQAGPR